MGKYDGYSWVYSPKAVKVSEELKKDIDRELGLVIEFLKKKYIKKHPKKLINNHLIDIYWKCIQQRFYLCSKYMCPKTYLSSEFENRFARLEYTGKGLNEKDKFQLFFMRYTGEWIKILEDKPLKECVNEIKSSHWFIP